ncbi:hypothetical protein HUG15_22635 [Salicibibacter cibarius]|uniref:DUF6922 domain-containing protein n=1 Tax=Salicibibacter cibarius TaxID=2743000 RepID=A0A7T6Z708_9BACI|nr:hypothetical protein HUG15_22635 [Salicibibacter cibarius]
MVETTFAKLFWGTDLDSLEIDKNQKLIIERVLNMRDQDELRWLWQTYSKYDIQH